MPVAKTTTLDNVNKLARQQRVVCDDAQPGELQKNASKAFIQECQFKGQVTVAVGCCSFKLCH